MTKALQTLMLTMPYIYSLRLELVNGSNLGRYDGFFWCEMELYVHSSTISVMGTTVHPRNITQHWRHFYYMRGYAMQDGPRKVVLLSS